MKTYIANIIPKIQRFSVMLDDLTMLIGKHWVVIGELQGSKSVFIFRKKNQLLISHDGQVEKAKWEFIDSNSILIERKDVCNLYRHGFLDANILALKADGKNEYAFLVNEIAYNNGLNSLIKIINHLNSMLLSVVSGATSVHSSLINQSFIELPVPECQITQSRITSSLDGNIEVHFIKYSDDTNGEIFLDPQNQLFYFKEEIFISSTTNQRYYVNKGHCINALYQYLKTGFISQKGIITSL